MIFGTVVGGDVVLLGITRWVGIWSSESENTKEWARALVTLILGGFVGYVTGRGTA